MKKALTLLLLLYACAAKEIKYKYIVTVEKKGYSAITQTWEDDPHVDTVYVANDIEAYTEGVTYFLATIKTYNMILSDAKKRGKGANIIMGKPTAFHVIDEAGVDISGRIPQNKKDSIMAVYKKFDN